MSYFYQNCHRVLSDAVSESVKPGYILFGSLNGKSSVTRGLNGIPTMMFYRSASTMVNGTLGSTVELLEAIEGREYEWLKDATPSYFPEVWILLRHRQMLNS